MAFVGLAHEVFKAGRIAGADAPNLRPHAVDIAAVVEVIAVVKTDAVKRIQALERHIIGHAPAGQLPQLFKQCRHGDDGRARIEHMAIDPVHIRAPARRIELF